LARIAGVDIPRQKRVDIALTYIYGVGDTVAKTVLTKTNINPETRVKDLTEDEKRLILAGNAKRIYNI